MSPSQRPLLIPPKQSWMGLIGFRLGDVGRKRFGDNPLLETKSFNRECEEWQIGWLG